jgi:adenylate cyclase class 2
MSKRSDTEIELKFRLSEEAFLELQKRLKEVASFVEGSRHVDDYYTPAHRDFLEPRFPFEWLSLRRRDGKAMLNYKHFYPEGAEVFTHCDEFELEVSDAEQLERILAALDFKPLIRVEKEREVYRHGEFEIGLDRVKGLGFFVEIEAMKDFGSVERARKRILELAERLGIDASKVQKRGYPFMLMRKRSSLGLRTKRTRSFRS